ncbi:DUF2752 domain-containing protein [Pseudactinotalea sp. HY160]|uniref:DUF2752 domain-containing protein n=1 Tax=Pseudactinotalea sp. HY160 TaxID=2654490 RepID=UPI00128DEA32|nr:DUF2752 domain-containing protein [Pseudactinotalea sp. HY160]MPV49922.1 DUF2752 domain-containing protein [Pseudactinotalea sp. HY160]
MARPERRDRRTPSVLLAVAAAATALVAVRDPHGGGYGLCPVLALTGWFCPTCGGLRAVHDLTAGDLAGAWAMNPLVTLAVPVAALALVAWTIRAWTGRRARQLPTWLVITAGAVAVLFALLRNLPALAPVLAPHLR